MIFLSYSHAQSQYADKIEQYLNQHHIALTRDRHEEKETDSISGFIRRVGEADLVILLISDEYMKSYYCLYEALLAYSHRDRRNLIPILLPEADILTWEGQLTYLRFWNDAKEKLRMKISMAPGIGTVELQKALRQIEAYSSYLGDFMAYIKDTVCIHASQGDTALETLYKCVCDKILDREVRYRAFTGSHAEDILLPKRRFLAIDFGTSYTLMAVLDAQGKKHLIPDRTGKPVHRSTIAFTENGDYQVGSDSPQAIRHIKRLIGIQDTLDVRGEPWSVTLLVAMILRSMVKNAEEYLGTTGFRVILAMPTDFSLKQKGILLESARIAGLDVSQIVQESSVESLMVTKSEAYSGAFIDLGGGTLDISLVEASDGATEILYSDGDSSFGSLDFDMDMVRMLKKKLWEEHGVRGQKLDVLAEQVKCRLNEQDQVSVTYLDSDEWGDMRMLPLTVTREEFEAAAKMRLHQFRYKLQKLSEYIQAGRWWKDSRGVIYLTGQGTKLYALKKIIGEVFPEVPLVDRYQESAVIRGLSHLARVVSYGINPRFGNAQLLINAMPSSIFFRGSRKAEEIFTTITPGENPDSICLLENDTTFPTKKSQILTFEFGEDEKSPRDFPMKILEKTTSGRECVLVDTTLRAEPGKTYEITVDIDAHYRVCIYIADSSSRERIREFHF